MQCVAYLSGGCERNVADQNMSMIMWQWQMVRFVLLLKHRISKTKHATRNYLHFNKTVRFMWLTLMSLPKQTVNLDDPTIGSRSRIPILYMCVEEI